MKVVKVLWIDDMQDWVDTTRENLEIIATIKNIKLVVVQAENGEDISIKLKMRDIDFDCIVMDYRMDPFNGDKYIKMIRTEDDYEHLFSVPIIFYSQDTDTNLKDLIGGLTDIHTVYRRNLEEKIKELFFE